MMAAQYAAQAGPPTENDDGLLVGTKQATGARIQSEDECDYAVDAMHDQLHHVLSLQRRYEALGWALHPLTGDDFAACRRGMHRVLHGRREAELFLRQVVRGAA